MILTRDEFNNIWKSMGRFRKQLIIYFLLGLPAGAIKGVQAYLVQPLFDKGFDPVSGADAIFNIAILLFLISVINYFFKYLSTNGIRASVTRITQDLSNRLIQTFLKADHSKLVKIEKGALINSVLVDIPIYANISKDLFGIFRQIVSILALVFVLIYQSVELSLYLLVLLPIFSSFISLLNKQSKKHGKSVRSQFSEITSANYHSVTNQKDIRLLNIFPYLNSKFKKIQKKYLTNYRRLVFWQEMSNPAIELVGVLFFCLVFYKGSMKIAAQEMSAGTLMSFLTSAVLLVDPLKKFSRNLSIFKSWSTSGQKIYDLLEIEQEPELTIVQGDELGVKDLSLSYAGESVIEDMNLSFNHQSTAILGESGSGKSSLIKVFNALVGDELKGAIRFPQSLTLKEMRELVAYLPQEPYLFNKSIKENIILNQSYDQELFNKCLSNAFVTEFLDKMPKGINTQLGANGLSISRGQAQRVCIARALYSQKPYLILDEATSALDNELDQKLNDKLLSYEGKIIHISHRVSSIKNYDWVVLMKKGKVSFEGSALEYFSN